MNKHLINELTEIYMLFILRKNPLNGFDLLIELDKYIGLENITHDHCFYALREKGYCALEFKESDGKRQGIYHITPKGVKRLEELCKVKKALDKLCELTNE